MSAPAARAGGPRAARGLRRALRALRSRAHAASPRELAERLALARAWPLERPVVFVLGLPRSGTTLVSQYLAHRLELAYWTNGVGHHPRAPLVTTWLDRRRGVAPSDFRSRQGKVEGTTAPREAGAVWGRFFDREREVRFEELRAGDARALRNLVAATQRIWGGLPFMNKNVKHMLRLDALARIFPESVFLAVRRRPQDVALSILRARLGSPDPARWFSVRPPEVACAPDAPIEEQVAAQVRALARRLETGLGALGSERALWLDYEPFCRDPDAAIAPLRRRLDPVGERHAAAGPFSAIHHVPTDAREHRLLALLSGHETGRDPRVGRSR